MSSSSETKKKFSQRWRWWPLLPLYPYGRKRTIFKELIPNQIWSFEQLQGIYYVAVPVRLTVLRVSKGLMLINPLPPTKELLGQVSSLEKKYGPVKAIVLPTASGLEHKISLPALARSFPKANIWICPGQWSFPIQLPLEWLGIPEKRTRTLFSDGLPYKDCCEWISLGPIDIGLGRFQEISCYHKASKCLIVTDALVGIDSDPPELFDLDPTPLLFHSREKGSDLLEDSFEARKKGWKRLVLFASFLRPYMLKIPSISEIIRNSFKPGLRNPKSHFGIYHFSWQEGWEQSAKELIGSNKPLLQLAPVIERLIFPRAKDSFLEWLKQIDSIRGIKWLIPAHYNSLISFNHNQIRLLKIKLEKKEWPQSIENWKFLDWFDKKLIKLKIVPNDPLAKFKD